MAIRRGSSLKRLLKSFRSTSICPTQKLFAELTVLEQQQQRTFFTSSIAEYPRSKSVPVTRTTGEIRRGVVLSFGGVKKPSNAGAPAPKPGKDPVPESSSKSEAPEADTPKAENESSETSSKPDGEPEILEEGVSFEKIEEAAKLSLEPMPNVIILGRPNVGKSSIYNRLVHRREAIVYDTPDSHVTRDIREGNAKLSDLRFKVFDSAGLETSEEGDKVLSRTTSLTEKFLQTCHAALFVIDGRAGLHPLDEEAAKWFHKLKVHLPVILVVNKAEKRTGDYHVMANVAESYVLGLGEPVPISAETGEGMSDLFQRLRPIVEEAKKKMLEEEAEEEKELDQKPLRLAIAGRTNVGKSTIINTLLRRERVLTGPEPGLTRDAIRVDFEFNKKPVCLVDTAGWIQRSQLEPGPVSLSAMLARRSLMTAHVVAVVLDAAEIAETKMTLKHSEGSLARWILEEGRALMIIVNKMDMLKGPRHEEFRTRLMEAVPKEIQLNLPQVLGVPIVFISALKGRGRSTIMNIAFELYGKWCSRIPTPRLNRWLYKVLARHPKRKDEKRARPRYMTQVKARPPTFVIFVSGFYSLQDHELRFLSNSIRDDFHLGGIPLRVLQRTKKELEGV